MSLIVSGKKPTNIFGLRRQDENSATFALGWALEHCPVFRTHFVKDITGMRIGEDRAFSIELQRHHENGGFTDVEFRAPGICHIIIEAKVGWNIPSSEQLQLYLPRLKRSKDERPYLVSMSAAGEEYARIWLPKKIGELQPLHRSWSHVLALARYSISQTKRHDERLWLSHLMSHLTEYAEMRDLQSNLVYVVALSSGPTRDGQPFSYNDVVTQCGAYYHPVGNGYPKEALNYIGFRYHGLLQSVHFIEESTVLRNVADRDKRWSETSDDHFVYRLGLPMRPATKMTTGKIFRNGRVWCAIDTLLSGTYETISDARDATRKRLKDDLIFGSGIQDN
jgi:hypothetical protein